MRRFSTVNLEKLLTRLKMPDDEPIKANVVTRAIQSAQTQVEQQNFETRKSVLKYDEVLDQQRKVIYAARWRILEGEDLQRQVHGMLLDVVTAYVHEATVEHRVKRSLFHAAIKDARAPSTPAAPSTPVAAAVGVVESAPVAAAAKVNGAGRHERVGR